MITNNRQNNFALWLMPVIGSITLVTTLGCRDPELDEFPWRLDDNYDPGVASEEPAPLCPVGSTQPINNSASPYQGGEVYADLVVEIFTYFECPNCAQLALIIADLLETRADIRDTVKFYFHHFPLYDTPSILNLHAAGVAIQDQTNEGFWEAHDYVYERLVREPPVRTSADQWRDYARDVLGLDMDRYDEVESDPNTMNLILWDKQQGVDLGVIGTPGIFICGKAVDGWSEIESIIDGFLY